jgi:hypothetical protein
MEKEYPDKPLKCDRSVCFHVAKQCLVKKGPRQHVTPVLYQRPSALSYKVQTKGLACKPWDKPFCAGALAGLKS